MKRKYHQIRRRLALVSDQVYITLIFSLFLSINLNAQSAKIFEKEVAVSPGVHIETNVPTSFWLESQGTMMCDNTNDKFIVTGKNGDQRLNINKEFNIHTWDKQVVRQEVKFVADLEDNDAAKSLLTALSINFENNADGTLVIDANINIEKFLLKNGFLRDDEFTVILENGEQHKVNRLEIESTLYIPIDANLTVEGSRNVTLRLDDIEGDLELILSYAEVFGKSVNRLKGNFNYCYNAVFDKVNYAEINAINSNIKMKEVKELEVGKHKISNRCLAPSILKLKRSNSFQNVFSSDIVEKMNIYESANDDFRITKVNKIDVIESAFCQFTIDELNESFNIASKNSEIKVLEVSKGFEEIYMTNTLGEIYLNFEEDSNYKLRLPSENYMESNINQSIKEIESNNDKEKYYQVGTGNSGEVFINCDRCMFTIK